MRRAVAVVVAFLAMVPHAFAHRSAKKPPWMTSFAWRVAVCETGKGHNHPDYKHNWRGRYGGAWGWATSTWQLDAPTGLPRYPWLATPRQQYRVFQIGMRRHRYWGCIANRLY